MATPQWVILEDNFPLSINQATTWLRLRRGECSDIDQIDHTIDGVLRYAEPPEASSNFIARRFIDPEIGTAGDGEAIKVYIYSRYWRVSLVEGQRYRLEYTAIADTAEGFTAAGYVDFNVDGDGEIRLIVPFGDGSLAVFKESCAYMLENANGDSSSFRVKSPTYDIGCSNPGSWYSNCVIDSTIAVSWNAGGDGPRHFLWNGEKQVIELSRNARGFSEQQDDATRCTINWGERLVVAGSLVYDLEAKRVYHFSGKQSAGLVTRPYFESHFKPMVVREIVIISTGQKGQFNLTVEYGQAEDALQKTDAYVVKITDQTKNRFRHKVILKNPLPCRVFRVVIDGLTETGITQLEALTEIREDVDAPDEFT